MRFRSSHPLFAAALGVLAACGHSAPAVTPAPVPTPPRPTPEALANGAPSSPALPPVPLVTGRLAPRVVYPTANAIVQARDSNFIFGSLGNGNASLTINGRPVHVWPNGAFLAWLPIPTPDAPRYDLVAIAGADTARLTQPIRLPPRAGGADSVLGDTLTDSTRALVTHADSARLARADAPKRPRADTVARSFAVLDTTPIYAVLGGARDSTISDTDRVVIARPTPDGTYKWFLFPGTVLRLLETERGMAHVRLDALLDAWVKLDDVDSLVVRGSEPVRVTGNARVVPAAGWLDLVIPIGARPAYAVAESGDDLVLTLYGTRGNTDIVGYRGNDPAIRTVDWAQETTDRARYTVHLRDRPFGYLAMWDSANASFVLRIRRTPTIDAARPLAGRTIAVDPGHPPIGATGPTGLWEPQATLWVGDRLADLLRQRGATVVMTRTTMAPVALEARPIMARRANAELLVSVHLNALPDGINPFRAHGTGTYFFHPQAEPLARAVQRRMVERMQLPDLGVYFDNLALARPTWMPSILCEGAFLMMPDQEAALRTPEFQEAYARGIADGIEDYFRALPADR